MLALTQAHALLIAERSRDIGVITEAVTDVLATNPYAFLIYPFFFTFQFILSFTTSFFFIPSTV